MASHLPLRPSERSCDPCPRAPANNALAYSSRRVATYQNGSPTAIVGPPTSGTQGLKEFWRDALGGEFRCTQAGTPGTWLQIRPAAVTADPSSGTIPVGYWVWTTTPSHSKRHAGGYVWEVLGARVE